MPASPGWPIQSAPSTLYSLESMKPSSIGVAELIRTMVCEKFVLQKARRAFSLSESSR